MKKISLIAILFTICVNLNAQKLQFHKNGTFKIVQFTDLHWDNSSENCTKTAQTMQSVLEVEKPDFVVFTGDVVTNEPVKDGWLSMTKTVIEAKVPWTVTFGNHDEEMNLSKETIYALLKTLPYFVGEQGNVSGVGNFVLPIYASSDENKTSNLMYFFDSQDYTHNPKLGSYDWIKADQIDWYRKESGNFTAKNAQRKIPSVAFFHIPLKEFNEVGNSKELQGNKNEGVASPEINSGLFSAMIEMKDMMGVFVGHDHDNNYIGVTREIALAFGQVTGADAYGDLERGARVIELQEGKFAFHTWIRTPSARKFDYYYPSGLPSITKETQVQKAHKVYPKKQGVRYSYYEYEGKLKTADSIVNLPVKSIGVLPNISIESAQRDDYFAFKYEAWLQVSETGFYKFYTYSDDGAKLYIDGKLVVNNDGGHSAKREDGSIALEQGLHRFELRYFESYMGNVLDVGMSSIEMKEQPIPNELFFIEK